MRVRHERQAGERLHTQPQRYRHAQARGNTSQSLQRVAELGVNLLARPQTASGWGRPDWWAQIIGQSRANMFAHLGTPVRRGSMPVLIDRHALWFVSNDPNPLTAAPGTPEGGFKTAYSAPLVLSREIKEAFRTMNCADQLARMLMSTI